MAVKLHSTTRGKGPPVVLLHGLFGSGSNLGALSRALQDSFTVYSVDLPNHGDSDWLEDADLASTAGAVGDWLSHQGLAQARAQSQGGTLAVQIQGQAIIAPMPHYPTPEQLQAMKPVLRQWATELGFADLAFVSAELEGAEQRLMEWLGGDYHGNMDYMARHGATRARPRELAIARPSSAAAAVCPP